MKQNMSLYQWVESLPDSDGCSLTTVLIKCSGSLNVSHSHSK